jgi:flagellar biosynthesis protein FlhA
MLRLSLNISSTKLIISEGHTGTDAAGEVIEGFANFIMGGNVILGIVIFIVLLIVNFVVITKGAGRMAEVGARFALDGMPGKQLAIDADMSAGAITHAEARDRRERELAETNFFGSLDGASKFVKGDAIAGLLITGLNMIVGLLVGVFMHDMPFSRAFETYAILTVGDGLVSQIPAVIISVAAALLLTRGGVKGAADVSFFAQLSRYPSALGTVALLMGLFAVVPGMPFVPFIIGAIGLAGAAYMASKRIASPALIEDLPVSPTQRPMGDVLDFDDIHIEFAPDLVAMVLDPATGLDARIGNMRTFAATNFGVILPEIRITDDASLPAGMYRIRLQGVERVRNRLVADRVLVLLAEGVSAPDGLDVMEPVYGAPARWIWPDDQERAALAGLTVVSSAEVLATHLLEIIKSNLARMLSLRGLRRLLDEFVSLTDTGRAAANRRLLEDLVPDKVPMDMLLSVLRLLLEERVSIRNLPLILEAIAEARNFGPPEAICEHVRQRLSLQITAEVQREDGTLPLIQLAPEWEKAFVAHQLETERGTRDVALPPELFARLANGLLEKINRTSEAGIFPAVVTSTVRRRFLRTVLAAKGLATPVLSYDELSIDTRPAIVGQVSA